MKIDPRSLLKSLSPAAIAKALKTFDRVTTVIIGVSWAAAILMTIFAIYVMSVSASSKRAVESALAAEPSLPTIVNKSMDARQAQVMLERMQHRFPDIKFGLTSNLALNVTAAEGAKFRQWLTALSYIDTISPEYHWSIQQFCVGKCNGELMHATLVGEKVSFQMPQQ